MEGLRTELMDAVLRLGNGGLGGVKDSGKFELKLAKCTKLADFVPLVITVQVRYCPVTQSDMNLDHLSCPYTHLC